LEKEQEISKLQIENEKLANSVAEENDRNVKAKYEIHEQVKNTTLLLDICNHINNFPCR